MKPREGKTSEEIKLIHEEAFELAEKLLEIEEVNKIYKELLPINPNFEPDKFPFDKIIMLEQIITHYFSTPIIDQLEEEKASYLEIARKKLQQKMNNESVEEALIYWNNEVIIKIDSYRVKILKEALKNFEQKTAPEILEIKDKDFFPVLQHNGLYDMIYNYPKLRKGKKSFTGQDILFNVKENTELLLRQSDIRPLDFLLSNLNESQIQVLCYGIFLHNQSEKDRISFDINEYLEIKGLTGHSKNVNKVIADLEVLSHTFFTFEANIKGKTVPVQQSPVIVIGDRYTYKRRVDIFFGRWINTLTEKQYSLIHRAFFSYNPKLSPHSIPVSIKLGELIRNNALKQKASYVIKVEKLLAVLDINPNTIKAKGWSKACLEPLEKALDEISAAEGYEWTYRDGSFNNFEEFKKTYIEFKNTKLSQAYRDIKRKRK